jgi:NDP-sugar pyrophosphorylase family protein
MQIVIPMPDADARPLAMVNGRTAIEHVTSMFPGTADFIFVCSRAQLEQADFASGLRRAVPTARIVPIEPHTLGPVYSTLRAAEVIENETPVIVSRCDFVAQCDFTRFRRTAAQQGWDGAVMAHRGFHPQGRRWKCATYLRHANRRLLEVRNGYGSASEEAREYAASGIYYFRTGAILKHYLHRAVALGLSTEGEYRVGLPYNLMVQDGLDVYVHELDYLASWSTPEELEEYSRWSEYFAHWADWRPARAAFHGATLIPMAGSAAVFAGSTYSDTKPLFPVAGVPMIERTLRTIPVSAQTMALCRTEDLKTTPLSGVLRRARPGTRTIALNQNMERHACLCLIPESALNSRSPVLVAPSDASLVYDEYEFAAAGARADCIVFTFPDHPHANRNPHQYGWVSTAADGSVESVTLGVQPSGETRETRGLTGMFWFREAGVMFDAIRHWLDTGRRSTNDFSLERILETLIAGGFSVCALDVTHYIPLVTPADVRRYEYWETYFRKCAWHPYGRQARIEPMPVTSLVEASAA